MNKAAFGVFVPEETTSCEQHYMSIISCTASLLSQTGWAEVINPNHLGLKVFMLPPGAKPVKQGLIMKSDTAPVVGHMLLGPAQEKNIQTTHQ